MLQASAGTLPSHHGDRHRCRGRRHGKAPALTDGRGLGDNTAASTKALLGTTLAEKNNLKVGSRSKHCLGACQLHTSTTAAPAGQRGSGLAGAAGGFPSGGVPGGGGGPLGGASQLVTSIAGCGKACLPAPFARSDPTLLHLSHVIPQPSAAWVRGWRDDVAHCQAMALQPVEPGSASRNRRSPAVGNHRYRTNRLTGLPRSCPAS